MLKTKSIFTIILSIFLFASIAAALSFSFNLGFIPATLLFWGAPAVYFSFTARHSIWRAILFSLLATVPFGMFIDYLGCINHVWYTPDTAFPFRLYGIVPLEDHLWSFLYVYSVIIIFESFIAGPPARRLGKKFYVFVLLLLLFAVGGHYVATRATEYLDNISYLYATAGILIFLIPMLLFAFRFRMYIPSFLKIALIIAPLAFMSEVVGLRFGYWQFPEQADLIGRLSILGVRIPYEELFFFILIGSLVILTYYVYFVRGVDTAAKRSSH